MSPQTRARAAHVLLGLATQINDEAVDLSSIIDPDALGALLEDATHVRRLAMAVAADKAEYPGGRQ
jgi:hypothetical protein